MRSGFISLIGRTNAGKSSLLNYLLGEKISMVSHKQNATRRKLTGIVMHEDNQAIFIDTPGLNSGEKVLNKALNESALNSLKDCDVVLFTASIFDDMSNYEKFLEYNIPHIIALTKIDLAKKEVLFDKLSKYQKYAEHFKAIIPISIKKQAYKKILLDEICKHLPEHEYYYDPEFLTISKERDIYRDFILESIFHNLSDEIPYSTDVIIQKVSDKDHITEIYADIITDNIHHKKILISSIKRIGISARKMIVNLTQNKIFLKLNVVVKKNWNSDEKLVKKIIF